MKHLKKFNELKSSTYYSAANKLKDIGHKRRSGEMYNWGKEVDKREEEEARRYMEKEWSKNGSFKMNIFETKGKTINGTYQYTYNLTMSGNFYVGLDFDDSMFFDMYEHWSEEHNHSLYMTFNMGIMPADEETRVEFNKHGFDSFKGIYWTNFLGIKLCGENDRTLNPKGNMSFDPFESDISFFSNRADAVRFKNLLADSIDNKINNMDIVTNTLDKMSSNIDVPNDIVDRVSKSIRASSVNRIYREE